MSTDENPQAEAVQIRAVQGRNHKQQVAADLNQAYHEDFPETAATVKAKVEVERNAAYWASRFPNRGW